MLTDLFKNNMKFRWTEQYEEGFENLKARFTTEPVVATPNFSKPFKVAIDASDVGVGVELWQEDDCGMERPIDYFSKNLNIHQAKYSTIEKEFSSLGMALQHFNV